MASNLDGGSFDVQLPVQHCISVASTGKSWKIPANFIKETDGGKLWLQVRASCFGLCNVVTSEKLDPKARPSLKDSKGLQSLINMRNEKVLQAGSSVGKKADTFGPDDSVVLPVGDEGASVTCKACSKANDDLHLLYSEANMSVFFSYLQEVGISISAAGEGSKRSYSKTGQYSKNAAKALRVRMSRSKDTPRKESKTVLSLRTLNV